MKKKVETGRTLDSKRDKIEFLLQADVIESFLPRIGKEQWQVLYKHEDTRERSFGIWCAFLSKMAVAKAMKTDSWDLHIGDGKPGFVQSSRNGREYTRYHRFGSGEGVRPLVLHRSFYGAFPEYLEIDEEFRLFHDLADDGTHRLLLNFDECGREIEVVRVLQNEILCRLQHLRQFQAATGLYLAIYIDSKRFSDLSLADIPSKELVRTERNVLTRWRRDVAKFNFRKPFQIYSRIFGKIILAPPARKKAGVWPFKEEDKRTVDFIIGVSENGEGIEFTSDPDKLADNFGGNADAPHYLTPVYFRREVLRKYFDEPERYTVSDGRLKCLSLWSCQIDNDLESHVVVFLGDLGRDLPYEERLHWRQFNVPPEGAISETNLRRSFLSQWIAAQSPDLTFRHEYAKINQEWELVYGWPLFLAPSVGDMYLLKTVRIPVTASQAEFDDQIGVLAKLLVDSLNEDELVSGAGFVEKGTKGIGKMEAFLKKTKYPDHGSLIQLLRGLQDLRSTGSAHRKGSKYERTIAMLDIDLKRKPEAIRDLLHKATVALRTLRSFYCEIRETER